MFTLSDADLQRRILGCGDGPASFNAEASAASAQIVSCDPLYAFDRTQIQARIDATYANVIEETRRNQSEFLWDDIPSVEALAEIRMQAMRTFLEDYEDGRATGRYVAAALPALPFTNGSFDLALCSHYLFLYTAHLTEDFHVAAVQAMCRVANEARIFPLLALGSEPSRHVEPVRRRLAAGMFHVTIERVPYEFQKGGNQMMRVRR